MGEEQLRSFFENELKPSLVDLEKQRKELKRLFFKFFPSFLLSILFFGMVLPISENISIGIAVLLALLGIYFLYLFIKKKKIYRANYKAEVVKRIIAAFDESWEYHPSSRVEEHHYRSSRLHSRDYDIYRGDDLIRGSIEKTDFEFSELNIKKEERYTDNDGNTKTRYVTVFKGIFAHMEFNKEIKGSTFVSPDAGKSLGKLGRWFENLNITGDLVKLENPEFEREYSVYGSDQIESRYVITPAIMEALLEIKKKYKAYTKFSFIGSRVYIAMNLNKDMFEPKVFKSIQLKEVQTIASQVNLIKLLITELNLNTRIWSKD